MTDMELISFSESDDFADGAVQFQRVANCRSSNSFSSRSHCSHVVFHDLSEVYPTNRDIQFSYSFQPGIIPDIDDRIALYKVCWSSVSECVTSICAKPPNEEDNPLQNNHRITFPVEVLPKDEESVYQFCYMSSNIVVGSSIPFTFCKSHDFDRDTGGLGLVFQSRNTQLQEQLIKAIDRKESLERMNSKLKTELCLKNEELNMKNEQCLSQKNSIEAMINIVYNLNSEKKELIEKLKMSDVFQQLVDELKIDNDVLLTEKNQCESTIDDLKTIISILAEWSVTGDADIKEFEGDPRFTALCQTLGRPSTSSLQSTSKNPVDDLTMVLNVKNDDEAAKIITTFTLQQMIKVLSSLAFKKRRSVPLLRSLSFSIAQNTNELDVKQGADILYALASLNYPDEVLLEKVSSDLYECIPKCKKTSVIGSISTSLGILRFKNIDLLDVLCEWSTNNLDLCRSQDLNSILFTLAHVNHQPLTCENFFKNVRRRMLDVDLCATRLEVVWSLTILGRATHEDYNSILNPEFYNRLKATHPDGLSVSCKKKLLNINGAAKYSTGYKGSLLEMNEELDDVLSIRSKDKQVLVTSVFEALSNLLPSAMYLKTNVNLNMGFTLDGECLVDSKLTPLPVVDRKTGEPLPTTQKGTKIAIFVWDYHEHTKGRIELCGVPSLCLKLAAASGYRVLSVPYLDFNPKDKLINQVQYLEKNMKLLVHPS